VTDPPETPDEQPVATAPAPAEETPWVAADGSPPTANEHPEIPVGAAFAGGFLLAMILRRLAR
jgi:hypothetical protein